MTKKKMTLAALAVEMNDSKINLIDMEMLDTLLNQAKEIAADQTIRGVPEERNSGELRISYTIEREKDANITFEEIEAQIIEQLETPRLAISKGVDIVAWVTLHNEEFDPYDC